MYKLALVHNPYDTPGLAGDDLFTEQGTAAALEGIEIRVNGIHPVDGQPPARQPPFSVLLYCTYCVSCGPLPFTAV